MVCLPAAPRRRAEAPLKAAVPVSNHEFSQVILTFLERFASVAPEAHSKRDGVHRPVQLQLMGKLSPGEDDHPKAQRAQHGHTLRIRRAAMFIKMVRTVVFNSRTARRRIYVNLEIPGLSEILELAGNIDPMVELDLGVSQPSLIEVAVSIGERAASFTRLSNEAARFTPRREGFCSQKARRSATAYRCEAST